MTGQAPPNYRDIIVATYADLKIIKTRGVVQVVFELPLHSFNRAVGVLDGAPLPNVETWVGVVRLTREAAKAILDAQAQEESSGKTPPQGQPAAEQQDQDQDQQRRKRQWWDLPPAQRAAMNCRDVRFQNWLHDQGYIPLATEAEAVTYVRKRVSAGQRSNLGKPGYEDQTAAWEELDHEYHNFLQRQRDEAAR